ncbi:HEAT repeat domain-containing protein [Sorangium sp. So ce406]|uniref:HEAT repeat domain-containing protein n=1 Tax=Sorangium sp. So ce406 TaxID=3133311 RepID=UPI003F5B99D1
MPHGPRQRCWYLRAHHQLTCNTTESTMRPSDSKVMSRIGRATRRAALAAALSAPVLICIPACSKAPMAESSSGHVGSAEVRWRASSRYLYKLHMSSNATLAQNAQPVDFELDGVLEVQARPGDGATSLLVNLREVTLKAQNRTAAPDPGAMARGLEGTWGFELKNGRAEQVRAPAGTSGFRANVLRSIAAALQHPTAERSGVAVEEVDATGTYTARYDEIAPGRFVKTKLSYAAARLPLGAVSPTPVDLTPTIKAFNGELRVDDGSLSWVELDETVEVTPALATAVQGRNRLLLELVRVESAPAPDWEAFLASHAVLPAEGPKLARTPHSPFDAARAGDASYEALLARLEQTSGALKEAKERDPDAAPDHELVKAQTETVRALGARLRLEPGHIAHATSLARKGGAASVGLLDALGIAGTTEAQAALVALANDKQLGERQRSAAAYSLIATQWPDPGSVDALIGWLDHDTLSEYALYGLGTFSRHLRAAGQLEPAKRAAEALLAELPRSQHTRRVHVLRGIANSGYPGAFEAVRPLLNDKDESVRAAAIESIRLMDRPEVDGILVEQIEAEGSLNLRLAALNAASVRSPSDALVRGVSELATGAPEAQSRLKAVQLLERWLRARPDVRPTLQQVADNENEREGVRRAAQAALAG